MIKATKSSQPLFQTVEVEKDKAGGFSIRLNDNLLTTPARAPFILPTSSLATLIQQEWVAQTNPVDHDALFYNQLCNAAIDVVRSDNPDFLYEIAKYALTDTACFHCDQPEDLKIQQQEKLSPFIENAAQKFGIPFAITYSLESPISEDNLKSLYAYLNQKDPFRLAGLQAACHLSKSFILAVALMEGEQSADDVFELSHLEELYSQQKWGEDAQEKALLDERKDRLKQLEVFFKALD